jgi:hypothetical protein
MSSVIFAFDAKLYIDEERYFEAGVSGLFAAIPMLRRIPMFKNYSKAFFTNLGFKLEAEAAVKLTIAEEQVITKIVQNKQSITRQMQKLFRQDVAQALPKTINYATIANDPVAIILHKVVNGTLQVERLAKSLGAEMFVGLATYISAEQAWAYLYKVTGLQEKQLQDYLNNTSRINDFIAKPENQLDDLEYYQQELGQEE